MNAEIKQLWNTALISGEYPQGCNALKNTYEKRDNFCVFGVLCDLYQKSHPESKWEYDTLRNSWFFNDGVERRNGVSTDLVNEWAGLDNCVPIVSHNGVKDGLTTLNDRGVPFVEIAQIIEEQL